jgi:hypothetical protein
MNNKLIIIATSFFILVSFIFLAIVEKKQADINTKNVWMIYFENPKDNSLNFTIENHSSNTNFHWQALSDNSPANQGDQTINLGESKTIPVSISDINNKKISIVVITGKEDKKEIYKIIAND